MTPKRLLVLLAASVAMTSTLAQSPKPEDQIKLRKAAYTMMGYSFGGLAAMAEGKRPYSKDEAIRLADLLAQVAQVPKHFFGEGTDKGTDKVETRAKPDIWTHRADFDEQMNEMLTEVAKLPQVARTGDLAALKAAAKQTSDACGQCHDNFRVKR